MKLTANSKCLIFMLVFVFLTSGMSWGQSRESFVIASPQTTSQIILDKGEELVVNTAAEVFAKDVFNVSGALPQIVQAGSAKYQIKAGTLGVNNSFDRECRESGIEIDALRPKWEAYCIKGKIDAANGNKILYVVGSNPRGTAYGLMELSRMIGVSPWYWWADVPVKKMMTLEISDNVFIEDSPSVKYRGIFLNDEGWGLWPWAKKTFDPEFGDIGPKTYEKIFELMLRLRANHIWPAMHPNTKSFQLVAENREVAKKFGIVVGSSHAEPLLFNNAGPEWDSRRDGPWDYNRNKNKILEVLEKQVENASAFENIYTMGLRGIHDSKMQGIDSPEEGAVLLEKIFEEQRSSGFRYWTLVVKSSGSTINYGS
ncbi:glycosyl hydrolase 115 family protein [Belliella marina]|uniref:Glycosyl hydrolase 115 family protein n=1 Tax=Belliella marina TaxID=1644146 RepID=A0ABW4VMP0_9BACT